MSEPETACYLSSCAKNRSWSTRELDLKATEIFHGLAVMRLRQ